jgi:signal peptidase I
MVCQAVQYVLLRTRCWVVAGIVGKRAPAYGVGNLSMKNDSTTTRRPGFESEIDCPLTVVELDYRHSGAVRPRPSMLRRVFKRLWPWVCFMVCSTLSYVIISHFILTTVVVQGRSMAPTLIDGDRYLLHRWELLFREPIRGDLVVIRDAEKNDYVVKRVVGLPGERIQFKDGRVYVNGEPLVEPYLTFGTETTVLDGTQPLVLIGAGRYFVMGDNRAVSEDSRIYGAVPGNQILGFIPQK